MVTIFDMVTGELLHSDGSAETAPPERQAASEHALLTPRLQTVEEAIATEARHNGMPADMVRMDIGSFVNQQ